MSEIMLMVNLHEIDFLKETLGLLAQEFVRDCMVREVDGIPSHHGGDDLQPNTLSSVAGLFRQQRNVNYLITAITEESRMEAITAALKTLYKEDRYVCSFWFVPIQGYWYHKTQE